MNYELFSIGEFIVAMLIVVIIIFLIFVLLDYTIEIIIERMKLNGKTKKG